MIYFVVFKYIPIWNAQIAFRDFQALDGVTGSPWVGFQNFRDFVNSYYFWELIRKHRFLQHRQDGLFHPGGHISLGSPL